MNSTHERCALTWAMSDELVTTVAQLSPITATFAGIEGQDHRWDDPSPEGQAEKLLCFRNFQTRLAALSPSTDADTLLARDVMHEHVNERVGFYGSEDVFRDLDSLASTFQLIPMVFDAMSSSAEDGRDAARQRLASVPAVFEAYRTLLAEGAARGAVVAKRQVRAVIQQARAQTRVFHDVATRFGIPMELADRAAGARDAMAGWLEAVYLHAATDRDAVGRERYELCVRRHLGGSVDLDATYAWGLDEFQRIQGEMESLAERIVPGSSIAGAIAHIESSRGDAWLDLPEPFLSRIQAIQRDAVERLAGVHFHVPAAVRHVDVKLAPRGGKVGAYYIPPSEDFRRPGCIWYSPGQRTRMPLWQEVTTAYHEGFPGHHLQLGIQIANSGRLSRFQRVLASWPGFSEGWALYAEQLMLELGGFSSPAEELGMHAGQLARAARVVVDIGLHLELPIPSDFDFHGGAVWNAELATEFMRTRAFMAREHAESDVVRYLGFPGQAISYKVGQRAIADARASLVGGGHIDLREFHTRILDMGSVGLDVLAQHLMKPGRPTSE